jgi:hypothetical protein
MGLFGIKKIFCYGMPTENITNFAGSWHCQQLTFAMGDDVARSFLLWRANGVAPFFAGS